MPVVDFRVRPPIPTFRDHIAFTSYRGGLRSRRIPQLHEGREEARSAAEFDLDAFFVEMDASGVTHGVIMGRRAGDMGDSDNEEIAEFCHESGGRFVGFGGIDGSEGKDAVNAVQRCAESGLVGIALDNGWVGLHQDDPELWPVYDKAAEEGLVVALTASQLMGEDLDWSRPDRIRAVALKFPGLQIIVSHGAWPWTVHACAVAYECPNVYLLPDCYLNTHAPGSDAYVTAANGFMHRQLLYGSAYPVRPMGGSLEAFKSLALTDASRRAALYENARNLLGWP